MPIPLPDLLHPLIAELALQLGEVGRYKSLVQAVQKALTQAPDELQDLGITSDITFLNFASNLLTSWIPSENADGTHIYHVLTVFYFIFDQDAIVDLQTPIDPASIDSQGLPKKTWLSEWLVRYAQHIGTWLDDPKSLTPESYQSFLDSAHYRMNDYLIPPGGFKCFNDLFKRHLKDASVRPIAAPEDPNVVVFPADSTFDDSWPVQSDSMVNIKSILWPMTALLHGSKYSTCFADGTWAHAFLNTFDYHRQHSPVAGKVVEAKKIQGLVYLQVTTKQDSKTGKRIVVPHRSFKPLKPAHPSKGDQPRAPDEAGYQFIQMRGCIVIDAGDEIGHVAVLPIGMAQVSSIGLSVKEGDTVSKGQEISWFEFGGSDIVFVFEKKANVSSWATPQEHHLMGEQLAILSPGKASNGVTAA
ncbi:hypothetical protein MMC34_006621 [Xylographa carneopallida]|nr:hypothetical protein [Xylographa carneopallida]